MKVVRYRKEIDGLRAIAVIPVVLYHAGFELFSGGYVGVDVFFVISGFLITGIIYREVELGQFSLMSFYERRARRILPALFFVVLFTSFFSLFLLSPSDLKGFGRSLIGVGTFSSNFVFWFESGYFGSVSDLKPLIHTWSLSVEEQFYLFFPVAFVFLLNCNKKWFLYFGVILAIIVSLAISILLPVFVSNSKLISSSFFLLPARAYELLAGSVAYFLYCRFGGKEELLPWSNVASFIGFVGLMVSFVVYERFPLYPFYYALLPVFSTFLIVVFANSKTIIFRFLGNRALVFIGLISYSLYLWHQPILALSRRTPFDDFEYVYGFLVLIVVVSFMSYRFIEIPFRNKYTMPSGKVLKVSGFSLVAFVVLGFLFLRFDGFFERQDRLSGEIGHVAFYEHLKSNYVGCSDPLIVRHVEYWKDYSRCYSTHSNVDPVVVFLGDSHVEHFYPGLAPLLESSIYLVRVGAPFVDNKKYDDIYSYIARKSSINTVVFSGYWYKMAVKGKGVFEKSFRETVDFLRSQSISVLVLTDTPDFVFDAEDCLYSDIFGSSTCSISEQTFLKQKNTYLDVMYELHSDKKIELVDTSGLFCGDGECSMLVGSDLMFRDNDHLNVLGSRYAAGKILSSSNLLQKEMRSPNDDR